MRNDSKGFVGKTTVSSQNTTAVLAAFRENQCVDPGDTLGWYHHATEEGDVWEIRPIENGGDE